MGDQKIKDLLKMMGIDQDTFDTSLTLDDYISTKINQHIEKKGYNDKEDFWCAVDDYGVNSFLKYDPIEGINGDMLKRWMEVIYPYKDEI